MQVGGAAAVADVAVGPHEVLGHSVDAEASERLAADVVQSAGRRFASEPMYFDEAVVALG